jgi:hypothetical protein
MHEITHPKTIHMIGLETGPYIPALTTEFQQPLIFNDAQQGVVMKRRIADHSLL